MFAAASVFCFSTRAQETPTFRAHATDVRVDVEVREGKRFVVGLMRDDFVVWDEGEVQQLVYSGQEAVGVDLVLLVDVSGAFTAYSARSRGSAIRHWASCMKTIA